MGRVLYQFMDNNIINRYQQRGEGREFPNRNSGCEHWTRTAMATVAITNKNKIIDIMIKTNNNQIINNQILHRICILIIQIMLVMDEV